MPDAAVQIPAAVPPPPPPVEAAPPAAAVAHPVTPPAAPAAPPAASAAAVPPAPAAQPPAPAKVETPPPAAAIEVKLPDGAKYDPVAIGEFKTLAAEHGLNSKQAQALLDFDHKQSAAAQKAFQEQVQRQRVADLDSIKGDKEFGGAQFDKTVSSSQSAMKQFFGEEGSKILVASGLDCHPAIVKGLARVRKAMSEDDTSSRAPGSVPPAVVKQQPQSQRARMAARYNKPK